MEFDHSAGYSPRACTRCKRLKRKCDKALPKCRSCSKSHFKCLYEDPRESASYNAATSASAASDSTSSHPSGFPPIYFLDFQLYQRTVTEPPRTNTVIRPEVQALTEDIREQANVYFRTIHPWIPFLSKKSFNERLLSLFTPRGTDTTLLFACVKLVCSLPEGEDGRTAAYTTIKNALLQAEMAGAFTFRVLQAWILLCVYEVGHAIYPSAYLSIGTCAKYAAALGLNGDSTDASGDTFHWEEAEERTRAWWAVVILDRFTNLGCPSPSLATEDPRNDTRLPIDDISWDQGISKHDHVARATLLTPPTPLMGRYGLMAQAAGLLGRVLHHLGDTKHVSGFPDEEAVLLDNALAALTNVANEEGRTRGIGVCTPTVICHSARITLALRKQSHDTDNVNTNDDRENPIVRYGIASDMIRLCQWATSEPAEQLDDEISPFPLNAAYHTAAVYVEMYSKKQDEAYLQGIWNVKALLTLYGRRWNLAKVYLKLIEAREAIYLSGLL